MDGHGDGPVDGHPDGPLDGLSTDSPFDGLKPDQQLGDGGVVPVTWVTIAKGTFTMGSPTDEPCRNSDEGQHQVTLTHDFEMQSTEVTGGQFLALLGYNPSQKSCGSTCPAETVSWHEAAAYCNALSKAAGKTECYGCVGSGASVTCEEAAAYSGQSVYQCPGYRLPTEAEWEYAYRAGTTTAYYNGGNDGLMCTTSSTTDANADKVGWYSANSSSTTHPVKGKLPNAWGLYDLPGNVWEWCHDWYQSSVGSGPATDPWGAAPGSVRVVRGGSWNYEAENLRAAARSSTSPTYRSHRLGLRCVRTR